MTDRYIVFSLLSTVYTTDEIGQEIAHEAERTVFGETSGVSLNEWSKAGQLGMKPEMRIAMFAPDYDNETKCIVNGTKYSIYRTYFSNNGTVELYLQRYAADVN